MLVSSSIKSATWATVTSEKAVVFSDLQMTSKLGFVRKGKKIRIGDMAKNKGQVYPFIFQKKIVYIKKEDIQTSSELLALQSAIERINQKSMTEENYQRISVGTGVSFYSISSDENYTGDTDKTLVMGSFNLRGQIVMPSKKTSIRLQLNYETGTEDKESYSLLNIETFYHIQFFRHKRLSVDLFMGALLTPYFAYEVGSDFTQNGFGVGASTGLEAVYRLNKRWSLHLNTDIRYQYLSVDLPKEVTQKEYNPSLFGLSSALNVSFSYE